MKLLQSRAAAVRVLAGAVIGTAALGVVCIEHAAAQKWPEKTVRIVTPFGPGGGATTAAVMGGEATTAFNTLETVLPLLRAKRLRPLAVSTRERATQQGAAPVGSTPAQFQSFLRDEIARWTRVIRQLGIKLD